MTVVAPATAAPTTTERPGAEIARDPVEQIDADMMRYGAWLARVTQIEARVQQQLSDISPTLQRLRAAGATQDQWVQRFRAHVQRAIAEVDAVSGEIEALDLPRITVLELPENVRPAPLLTQIREFNRNARALLESYLRLFDVAQSDPRAVEAAMTRLFADMRLIFESKILLLRARQASTPQDDPAWEVQGFELTFQRAALRIFRALDPFEPRVDPSLPDELVALAEELDGYVRRAREKLGAELIVVNRDLAGAERLGDATQVRVWRRIVRAMETMRESFPLAEQLASHLRENATVLRGRPLTMELLVRVFTPLRTIRAGLNEITLRQIRLLADQN